MGRPALQGSTGAPEVSIGSQPAVILTDEGWFTYLDTQAKGGGARIAADKEKERRWRAH